MKSARITSGITWFVTVLILISIIPLFYKGCWNLLISIGTFATALVALFREKLLSWYFPPELKISAKNDIEHFHEALAVGMDQTGTIQRENQKWLGVVVKNVGLGNANNVEVYFRGLKSNMIDGFESYRTIPLKTSWRGNEINRLLPPGVGLRWDVCYISQENPKQVSFHFTSTPNTLTSIELKDSVNAYFKFEILAMADNSCLSISKIVITYSGNYDEGLKVRCYKIK